MRVGEISINQAGLWGKLTLHLGSAGPEGVRVCHDSFGSGQNPENITPQNLGSNVVDGAKNNNAGCAWSCSD